VASIEVRRFEPSRRDDFFGIHCDANGAGHCFCVAWWVPTWDGWARRTAGENRDLRERLLQLGEYDGYLLYADGVPAMWAQVGPRDRLTKVTTQFGLAPDPHTWAISCFQSAPSHRRRGLASRLLDEILRDLPGRGARRVEAYPKRGEDLEPDDLWNGPESMFRAAGFRVARDDPVRPVLALDFPH
jgi:GNAT superfamily N-acetyltransferase